MKNRGIWIFFSLIFVVYFGVNWYVLSRGIWALEGSGFVNLFIGIYCALAFSFIAGQVLERGKPTLFGRIITHIGSIWLAVFLYSLLFVIFVDIVRLFDSWLHLIPSSFSTKVTNGEILFIVGSLLALLITGLGYINARFPRLRQLSIQIQKELKGKDKLRIALITDLHIGAIIGRKRVRELVNRLNNLEADIVIFGGDVVDHNPLFAKMEKVGPELGRIKSSMGVFAVAGNHEFIGHADVSIEYLQAYGVKYIRDEVINIDNIVLLAGRDDRERIHHEGEARKPIEDILSGVDKSIPLILIDHQPVEYDKVKSFGLDLMLSGHTHKGQLWPFGYITKLVYENDYGLMKKDKTAFYTSSGYGTWGPPVRTGNKPELVVFDIVGRKARIINEEYSVMKTPNMKLFPNLHY